jgi:coenzyme F420-reducing hydrogenase delta subunit
MRLIRVMCSGRIDPAFVLRAFSQGADGVFIGACHLGECNYITHGNYHTLNMVLLLRLILEHLGLDPERLRMSFMSGAEANLFVENVNDFVKKIKLLGPVGAGEGIGPQELKRKLETATELVPYIRLVERERLRAPMMSEEAFYAYFADYRAFARRPPHHRRNRPERGPDPVGSIQAPQHFLKASPGALRPGTETLRPRLKGGAQKEKPGKRL